MGRKTPPVICKVSIGKKLKYELSCILNAHNYQIDIYICTFHQLLIESENIGAL
jgi:hypothetical protein